jgi:hypothetical protein
VGPSPALPRASEQLLGVVDAVDIEACFGEQVRVPPLAAGDVEHARADRQAEDVDDARHFLSVTPLAEERLVLVEVSLVEERCPPLVRTRTAWRQKKTGSR